MIYTSSHSCIAANRKIQYNEHHCIHDLLPPLRASINYLRPKGHSFELPRCAVELHEKSFLPRCLFKYVQLCNPLCFGFVRVLYFCSSVLVSLSFIFRVFFCTTYMLKFFIYGYYCINVCFMFNKDQSINQFKTWQSTFILSVITTNILLVKDASKLNTYTSTSVYTWCRKTRTRQSVLVLVHRLF